MLDFILRKASHLGTLPVFNFVTEAQRGFSEEEKAGFKACQRLAQEAAKEVASLAKEGWTEIQAAKLLETYLLDSGVEGFFHHSFAWFGERTRFDGIRQYSEFSPSARVLLPNEIFILDVAPIYRGYTCDIGYTSCLGENPQFHRVRNFLAEVRESIPGIVRGAVSGSDVWQQVEDLLTVAGYENIHQKYPFSVLGHRLHRSRGGGVPFQVWNFGWQSFWDLTSRGLFGQLLTRQYEGSLDGLWAIEPHLGGKGFGAKFEEILVIEGNKVHWLDDIGF